jgi:prepilin-type N-terminal cleavage/methylation domain-containing protein
LIRPTPARRPAGFTLLELLMALAIASVLMVVVGNILISSTRSVDSMVVDSVSDQEIRQSLNRMLDEMQMTSTSRLAINSLGTDHDSITFQTPSSYAGAVTWGAKDAAGTWHADWTVRYTVVNGQLVRQVLNSGGSTVGASAVLARGIDGLSSGTKGFRVGLVGPVASAALRVRKQFRDGKVYTKEFSSSVYLKNG